MRIKRSTMIRNWFLIILVMIIGFSVVGFYIAYNGIAHSKESSQQFADFYLNENKELVKREVLNRIEEIDNEQINLIEEEKLLIQDKVNQISWILLDDDAINVESFDEKRRNIIKVFESIIDQDSSGLYFALDRDGTFLTDSSNPSNEGLNLLNHVDCNGSFYVQEMLDAVNHEDGIYVTYCCPIEENNEQFTKSSYCFYIEAYDIIIGASYYEEEIQAVLQERIVNRLQSYYEGKTDYIFIIGYDTISRVNSDKEIIGKSFVTLTDVDGKSIYDLLIDAAKKEDGDFVQYAYYKPNSNILTEKISYVQSIDEWDCFIGMGFHIDDLKLINEAYESNFKSYYLTEVLYTIIGLILIALIVFALIQRGSYLQRLYMTQEEAIFTQLIQLSDEAIAIISTKGQLLYTNSIADKLLDKNIQDHFENGQLNFEKNKELISKIVTKNERIYYTEIKSESLVYHGLDSYIYFIKDITKQYLKSNEFERLSLIDELTGLANRRSLNYDFEDMYFNKNSQGSTIIAIIDLDDFKGINDSYGHDIGDQVIILLGNIFRSRLRHSDTFYRYGGEEFVIVMKDIDLDGAQMILTDINESFRSSTKEKLDFEVTFSGGAVAVDWTNKDSTIQTVIKSADTLLYKAKANGKNRIEI